MDRRTTGLKNDGTPDKRTTQGKRLLEAQQTPDRRTTGLKNDGTPDKRTTEGKRLLAAQQTPDSIPHSAVLGIVFVIIGCYVLLMLVKLISTILCEVCAFLSAAANFLAFCLFKVCALVAFVFVLVVFVFVLVTVCRFLSALLGAFLAAASKEREAARTRQSMPSSRPQRATEEVSDKQYGRDAADSYNECVACLDQEAVLMIVPCGHRCLCRNCGDNVMSTKPECPLCRSSIKGFNQLPSKAEAKIAAEKAAAEKAAAEKAAADAKAAAEEKAAGVAKAKAETAAAQAETAAAVEPRRAACAQLPLHSKYTSTEITEIEEMHTQDTADDVSDQQQHQALTRSQNKALQAAKEKPESPTLPSPEQLPSPHSKQSNGSVGGGLMTVVAGALLLVCIVYAVHYKAEAEAEAKALAELRQSVKVIAAEAKAAAALESQQAVMQAVSVAVTALCGRVLAGGLYWMVTQGD